MLTDRDYELLSEYLDGELSESERAALESRLSADAELSRELAGLRETVALVKTLTPRKAPRDFTLNANVVARPAARRFLFSSSFYSAVSAAAAVLLIGFGLLFAAQSQNAALPVNALQSVAIQQEEAQDIALAASPTSVLKTSDGSVVAVPPGSEIQPTPLPPQATTRATPTLSVPDSFNIASGGGGESPLGNTGPTDQGAQSASAALSSSEPSPAQPPVEAAQAYAPLPTNSTVETPQEFTFAAPVQGGELAETETNGQGFTTQADEAAALDQTPVAGTVQREADTATPAPTETLTPTRAPTPTETTAPGASLPPQPNASRTNPLPAPLNISEVSLALGAVLLLVSVLFFIRSRSNR
jgi:hypothetical protein